MNTLERQAVISLASIFGFRMLGLFVLLPVLSIHAQGLQGQTAFLMGMAMGVYGLTQALLQIPFGFFSDRYGRRPLIVVGLLIFFAGSVFAAMAENIYSLILARALQGAGAISAVLLALLADLVREQQRAKAMAVVGMSIGGVFLLSLLAGPLLAGSLGVSGVFWFTATLAVLGLLILWRWVPVAQQQIEKPPQIKELRQILADRQLLSLNVGIFFLHAMLTAFFVIFPLYLVSTLNYPVAEHWKIYALSLLGSLFVFLPLIRMSASNQHTRVIFSIALVLLFLAYGIFLWQNTSFWLAVVVLSFFFSGFNTLEAMLPSLVSRMAPTQLRGAAMGVYSSSQFLGVFFGGISAGWLFGIYGVNGVIWLCATIVGIWFMLVIRSRDFSLTRTISLHFSDEQQENVEFRLEELRSLRGVVDVTFIPTYAVAYLRIRAEEFDRHSIDGYAQK